jgi:hypothetical protein
VYNLLTDEARQGNKILGLVYEEADQETIIE